MVRRFPVKASLRLPIAFAAVMLLIGCATEKPTNRFTPKSADEVRPRLAQLRKGMKSREVDRILNLDMWVGPLTALSSSQIYPPPIRPVPPAYRDIGFELTVFYSHRGIVEKEDTFEEAILKTDQGTTETWPK